MPDLNSDPTITQGLSSPSEASSPDAGFRQVLGMAMSVVAWDIQSLAIAEIEAGQHAIDEAQLAAAIRFFATYGSVPPIIIDRDKRVIFGRSRLEAARRLGLQTIQVLRLEELTPQQRRLQETAGRSPSVSASREPSAAARLNARAEQFWSGKRGIVASILQDEVYNKRFRMFLRAQSGRPVRRQRSEIDLAVLAATGFLAEASFFTISGTPSNVKPVNQFEKRKEVRSELQFLNTVLKNEKYARRNGSRRGGMAPKADALTKQIDDIVKGRPDITERQLLSRLRDLADPNVLENGITSVGPAYIFFLHNNKERKAPIKGLKDRLRRSKKRRVATSRKAG